MRAVGLGRVWRNASWNLSAYGVSILVLVFSTPIFVESLGLEQFGLYGLLAALTGPLSVFSVGTTQATVKYVSEVMAGRDHDRLAKLVSSSLALNAAVGCCGFIILFVAADPLARRVFAIPANLRDDSILAIQLTGFIWFVAQWGDVFRAGLEGLQEFKPTSIVQVLRTAAWGGGGSVLLLMSPNIVHLIWFQLLIEAGSVMALGWLLLRASPSCHLWPRWDRDMGSRIFLFSRWQIANGVAGNAAGYADRLFLAGVVGLESTGIYSVALRVANLLRGVASNALKPLYPAVSAAAATSADGERLLLAHGRTASAAGAAVYGGLFAVALPAMSMWLGPEIGQQAALLLQVLLISLLLELPGTVMQTYLLARAMTRPLTLNNMGVSIVTLASLAVLGSRYGVMGVAWSGVIGLILIRVPYHLVLFTSNFDRKTGSLRAFADVYGVLANGVLAAVVALGSVAFVRARMPGPVGSLLAVALGLITAFTAVALVEISIAAHRAKRPSARAIVPSIVE